jgi:hypothetical protein
VQGKGSTRHRQQDDIPRRRALSCSPSAEQSLDSQPSSRLQLSPRTCNPAVIAPAALSRVGRDLLAAAGTPFNASSSPPWRPLALCALGTDLLARRTQPRRKQRARPRPRQSQGISRTMIRLIAPGVPARRPGGSLAATFGSPPRHAVRSTTPTRGAMSRSERLVRIGDLAADLCESLRTARRPAGAGLLCCIARLEAVRP